MPQLNKGGKFVFGFSVIRSDLTIHITLFCMYIPFVYKSMSSLFF